jgi:hypothetical protein
MKFMYIHFGHDPIAFIMRERMEKETGLDSNSWIKLET